MITRFLRLPARGATRRRPRAAHPFGALRGGAPALRVSAVVVLGVLTGSLAGNVSMGSVSAGPPLAAHQPAAGAPPDAILIVDRAALAPGLAEVRIDRAAPGEGIGRLLAISNDGQRVAVAGRVGPDTTTLTLADAGGAQQVQLPGLVAAAFAVDGSWLAAIDGSGSLWRIADEVVTRMGVDGPFAGQLVVEPDGSVLALRVSSVEAPVASHLVRIAPDGASAVQLSGEPLVYGVQPLADGNLAFLVHGRSGNLLLRLAGGRASLLADLGEDAVHASVSADGRVIAFERAGQVFVRGVDGTIRPIGTGSRPRVAPDGHSLLVELPSGAQLLTVDGRSMARFAGQAAFAACGEECGS